MANDGQSKQAVRGLITIIVNGVALLAFGLGMTGWLNPWLGVSIMGVAVLYWIWELFNAPLAVQSIPPMLRFVGAIVLACIVVGISVPRIRDKIRKDLEAEKAQQNIVTETSGTKSSVKVEVNRAPKTNNIVQLAPETLHGDDSVKAKIQKMPHAESSSNSVAPTSQEHRNVPIEQAN